MSDAATVSEPVTTTTTASSPPHQQSYRNLIIAVTLIASITLCLILRNLIKRRCLRHLFPSSSFFTVLPTVPARLSTRRHVAPENPTTSFIDSLPLFSFSSVTRQSSSSSVAADCAICLSKFEPDDQLRVLPRCCHAFHAECVDTWLHSNQTCPLCRSSVFVSEAEILNSLPVAGDSFMLEIRSISRRRRETTTSNNNGEMPRSYFIGSFHYVVEDNSEVSLRYTYRPPPVSQPAVTPEQSLTAEIATSGSGRGWLNKLSMSLSSRALSFRSSGQFFTGSSRRSEVPTGNGELERAGEEISRILRWLSDI